MDCYLENEPKRKDYGKPMITLWVEKSMFKVAKQRLLHNAIAIRRGKLMTELEVERFTREVDKKDEVAWKTSNSIKETV